MLTSASSLPSKPSDLMMEFAGLNYLKVLNFSEKCVGRNTRGDAVIDYVLWNQNMQHRVIKMGVDEGRTRCELSDHDLITVSLKVTGQGNKESTRKLVYKLDESKAASVTTAEIGRRLIDVKNVSCEEIVKLMAESTRRIVSLEPST